MCPDIGLGKMTGEEVKFASRAGAKLEAAMDAFGLDVRGLTCADFGCNVGGFTDCLLRRGAARVYAIDTGRGELAWKLRRDARVVVMERTNALHVDLPEPADLVTIDVAWTPQQRVIPAALRLLRPGGNVVSLLKPHYELAKLAGRKPFEGLSDREADDVCRTVCGRLAESGWGVRAAMRSVMRGKGGALEYLLWLSRAPG